MDISNAKVCIPTSSGGHLMHMWLLSPVWEKSRDRFWVTFNKADANALLKGERVYHCYYPTNRNFKNLIKNAILAIKVIRRERPDLIISSGAAVAVPFFYVGKIFGAKCVYVEVFDRIDASTLTGKLVSKAADIFAVQWKEQLDVYPGAIYLGPIY